MEVRLYLRISMHFLFPKINLKIPPFFKFLQQFKEAKLIKRKFRKNAYLEQNT